MYKVVLYMGPLILSCLPWNHSRGVACYIGILYRVMLVLRASGGKTISFSDTDSMFAADVMVIYYR